MITYTPPGCFRLCLIRVNETSLILVSTNNHMTELLVATEQLWRTNFLMRKQKWLELKIPKKNQIGSRYLDNDDLEERAITTQMKHFEMITDFGSTEEDVVDTVDEAYFVPVYRRKSKSFKRKHFFIFILGLIFTFFIFIVFQLSYWVNNHEQLAVNMTTYTLYEII